MKINILTKLLICHLIIFIHLPAEENSSSKNFKMHPDLVKLADNTWRELKPKFVHHPDQLAILKEKGKDITKYKPHQQFCHSKGEASLCYDWSSNVSIYFGGCTSGYGNNLWIYSCSDNVWTQIHPDIFKMKEKKRFRENPKTHPPGCCSYGICYDSDKKLSVIGRSNGGATAWIKSSLVVPNNKIWSYDASDKKWIYTPRNGLVPTSYMTGSRMAYDPVKKECLLYATSILWAYNGSKNTWRKVETKDPKPNKRGQLSFIYLEKLKKVLLYGGQRISDKSIKSTTWLYDPQTEKWENITIDNGPGPRSGTSMAYDSLNHVAVMIGGWKTKPSQKVNDGTWIFDPNKRTWEQHKNDPMPLVASCYRMSYDRINNVMIYVSRGRTWVYRHLKEKGEIK